MIQTPSLALVFALAGALVTASLPAVAAPPQGQQNRMAVCNKDAVGKKGDERKAFMKQCLSGKSDASAPAPAALPAGKRAPAAPR